MELFDAIKKRRSIRRFTAEVVPDAAIKKALEAAVLAPNSSNIQAWNFYWVRNLGPKQKLVEFCLNQSAARTASHLIVVIADPGLWKRSQGPLVEWVEKAKAPQPVHFYYKKLIPLTYRWGFMNSIGYIKKMITFVSGLFRPMPRGPNTLRDLQEVCIKSAALASENFVLAITAQGFATCMMEGFDEVRVKKLLKLPCRSRVVMVIAVGREADRGTWGPQFRLPIDAVVKEV
jgi:nitroreductase